MRQLAADCVFMRKLALFLPIDISRLFRLLKSLSSCPGIAALVCAHVRKFASICTELVDVQS